jgi:hypothetical protein
MVLIAMLLKKGDESGEKTGYDERRPAAQGRTWGDHSSESMPEYCRLDCPMISQ